MDFGAENYRLYCDGDDSALEKIIAEYQHGLTFYISGIVGNFDTAENLCEDTFYTLAVKKPRFKGKSQFKTFLYSIARYVTYDFIRHRKNDISLENTDISDSEYNNPEIEYFKKEVNIAIHKCLGELKTEYRDVIWLFYFENLKISDISRIMKKSNHSIETLLYRARNALREKLAKEGITYEKLF